LFPHGNALSDLKQFLLLLRYHVKMARGRSTRMFTESKLMVSTLSIFLLGYGVMGYVLFSKGLIMVQRVPSVGGFLADRVIFLLFFFFFIMLIFSVGVTNFIGLIKGREIPWLHTLPLSHRVIFLWKSTEAIVFASWGLVFISFPLLLAFGTTRNAPTSFYPHALALTIAFVIVASTVGSALFLGLLRWISRKAAIALIGVTVLGIIGYGFVAYDDAQEASQRSAGMVAVDQILKHTEASVHPLSPSTWMSRALLQRTRAYPYEANWFTTLLWSWALMGIVSLGWLGGKWFYPAWNRNLERAAHASSRRRERSQGHAYRWVSGANRVIGLDRPIRAVIRKDVLTFLREPSQWVQFVIVFGLLLIYVLNLRNMGYDYENPYWSAIISYINLTVCSLAVSTLTTRFVFPQFSLEGSRIWILGLAPLGLERVVLQKWVQAMLCIGTLTTLLQLTSGLMLQLPVWDIVFFTSSIALISAGLCGISVGLGALFPNLEETNAAKIVSGFGGTLCLICSFLYIVCFISMLSVAKIGLFQTKGVAEIGSDGWMPGAIAGIVFMTVVFGGVPILLAMKRVKRLELFGPLS
tara:strand:- start:8283 stop:10025 length:1743 start_codon:yes stop_codon:yes gene_type:complete